MNRIDFIESLRDYYEQGLISDEIRMDWQEAAQEVLIEVQSKLEEDNSTELAILSIYASIFDGIEANPIEQELLSQYHDITNTIRKSKEDKLQNDNKKDSHSKARVIKPVSHIDKHGIVLTIAIMGLVLVAGIFIASLAIALK